MSSPPSPAKKKAPPHAPSPSPKGAKPADPRPAPSKDAASPRKAAPKAPPPAAKKGSPSGTQAPPKRGASAAAKKTSPPKGAPPPPPRPNLAVLLDGQPLPEDEARAVWTAFSEHMDWHVGDFDGFATAKGWKSVRPEHRRGQAVLVASSR